MISSNQQATVMFILPLIFAVVHGAALHKRQQVNCDSRPLGAMIRQFYCTSDSLRKLSKLIVAENNATAPPAEHSIDTVNQGNINITLQEFDFTCKTFTTAMAIKYQLQNSLFNGTYYFNDSNGDKGIKNLTSILEYLETIADTLQDIKKNITNKRCIVFSSVQYKRLYWNFINGSDISVLNTLQGVRWAVTSTYPLEWKENGRCALPSISSCNNST